MADHDVPPPPNWISGFYALAGVFAVTAGLWLWSRTAALLFLGFMLLVVATQVRGEQIRQAQRRRATPGPGPRVVPLRPHRPNARPRGDDPEAA